MFREYFQLSQIPSDQLTGVYDYRLVILSFLVAAFASYIALDLTGRLRDLNNTQRSRLFWYIGGSITMGAGIWSMHFIGMLSFSIPGLVLQYDIFWTVLSLFVAIFASGFALWLLQAGNVKVQHYIAGGILLGFAIASMHYTGMEAMLIVLDIHYLPMIFMLSIVVAIVASEAAVLLALKSNMVAIKFRNRVKVFSAIVMGIAICGMHYTAMAASIFTQCKTCNIAGVPGLDPTLLSSSIAAVTFIIMGIALFASSYQDAINQDQFEKVRQLGMAEISASILHNVGNVLNSVNTSSRIVSDKITNSKLIGLEKLSNLLNENKDNLASFLTQDSRGSNTLDFINMLSEYWQKEQETLIAELDNLDKNLTLITEIISTQQTISKTVNIEQLLSINDLLNEALLITGLNLKQDITIEKDFQKIYPIKIDKVKFLPVLVNLLRNAKDAVMASAKPEKIIKIKTYTTKNKKVRIEIVDNGVGILNKNLTKIFNYGFTTKEKGHGFGLHTSAISINQMGGEVTAMSEGIDQGATFVLELPYKS